jgi:hypothetical protein
MKKIILFLVVVGLGFFGWKMYSSRGTSASETPESNVKKVENTNSAPTEVAPVAEPSTAAETSVQVLPSPKQ